MALTPIPAIRIELCRQVRHRVATSTTASSRAIAASKAMSTNAGLKNATSAARCCRCHDELRNFLRCRPRMRQYVPAATRRWQHMRKTACPPYPRNRHQCGQLSPGPNADIPCVCFCREQSRIPNQRALPALSRCHFLPALRLKGALLIWRDIKCPLIFVPSSFGKLQITDA